MRYLHSSKMFIAPFASAATLSTERLHGLREAAARMETTQKVGATVGGTSWGELQSLYSASGIHWLRMAWYITTRVSVSQLLQRLTEISGKREDGTPMLKNVDEF